MALKKFKKIEEAWLGLDTVDTNFFNPMSVLDPRDDDFHTKLSWLMIQPEYLSFMSSQILNILIIYIIIQAISTPIKLVLYALDKEKLLLLLILPLPIIKIVLNLLYFNLFGIAGIAYSTVIVYAIYLLLLIIVNRNLLIKILKKPR